nr:M56 family metallopeptidase [uncultured Caproiciproducens sp.]
MGELFFVYLQNSLQLSSIALLMLAVSPLLAHRYSAKCRYYLWAVVFAALLLPIRTNITLELPEFFHTILPQTIGTTAPDTAAITKTVNTWDWHNFAGLLWAAGTFCFLSWHFFQHLRFLSAIRRWHEEIVDTAVLELFAKVKAELKIREHITIKSCVCIKTPMVMGLLRPTVLLPQVNLSQDELPLILKHELVHYRRKDLWYKALMLLTMSIHWFNPVVHLMVKSVLNLCEISCDEEVLKGIEAKGRARYGESVIGTVRNSSSYKTALSTNFYSGTKGMKKRIYAMMDMRKKRFSPVLFLAVLMLTLCGTTAFALSPTLSVVPESSEQQPNQTMMTDTEPSHVDTTAPVDTSDTEQGNLENQSSNDNSLPPNELIPTYNDASVEPAQAQTYGQDAPRIIID